MCSLRRYQGLTADSRLTLLFAENVISTNRRPLNSLDYSPFESSHSSSVHSVEVFVFITFLESCLSSTLAFSLTYLSQGRRQKEPLVKELMRGSTLLDRRASGL